MKVKNNIGMLLWLLCLLFLIDDVVSAESNIDFTHLQEDIANVSYQTYEYQTDIFDCSNMAGLMVTELDKLDYNAELVIVKSKVSKNCYHTFVIIDREVIIEPTFKLITFSEGKYGDFGSIEWYIQTWNVIGVYSSIEDAGKRSKWSALEFNTFKRDIHK